MNKEQIEQKFKDYLTDKFCFYASRSVIGFVSYEDLVNVMKEAFNLGLEMAADNAEADYNLLGTWQCEPGDIEVYVLKNSILKHKL